MKGVERDNQIRGDQTIDQVYVHPQAEEDGMG